MADLWGQQGLLVTMNKRFRFFTEFSPHSVACVLFSLPRSGAILAQFPHLSPASTFSPDYSYQHASLFISLWFLISFYTISMLLQTFIGNTSLKQIFSIFCIILQENILANTYILSQKQAHTWEEGHTLGTLTQYRCKSPNTVYTNQILKSIKRDILSSCVYFLMKTWFSIV